MNRNKGKVLKVCALILAMFLSLMRCEALDILLFSRFPQKQPQQVG